MTVKRQHYVPKFLLRGFSIPRENTREVLWIYDKTPSRQPFSKSIKNYCCRDYYYSYLDSDGIENLDGIEKKLAETIDDKTPKLIARLNPEGKRNFEISDDDKELLSTFIGFQLSRVPSFRDGINDFYQQALERHLDVLIEAGEITIPKELPNGRDDISVNIEEWKSLEAMMIVAEELAKSVFSKNWQFFVPPEDNLLVTSDNPVYFSSPNPMIGVAHPLSEVVLHLRKDLALVCTHKITPKKNPIFKMTKQEAKKFNKGVARNAQRFVFASERLDGLDRLTKKYYDTQVGIRC
jgi:hypothetical protein